MKIRKIWFVSILLTSIAWVHGQSPPAKTQKIDSLKAFQIVIGSEMKQNNRVMVLKNRHLSDSLMDQASHVQKNKFEGFLSDTNIAHEVKSQEEFVRYWKNLEAENGIKALKDQYSRADIDKSLTPKKYLFDSSVVVYPGVIILRNRILLHPH